METHGRHLIIEFDGCDRRMLTDQAGIREALLEAARQARATAVSDHLHTFPGGGVCGVVVLAESHISIHTWPEHRYAAVDIYTCGSKAKPHVACLILGRALRARHAKITSLDRGVPCADGTHESAIQEALIVPLRTAS